MRAEVRISRFLAPALLAFSLISCQSSGEQVVAAKAGEVVDAISVYRVQPAETGPGVSAELQEANYHYVALPGPDQQLRPHLVLYMGGSLGNPERAGEISDFLAGMGFPVLNIRYPNDFVVGISCLARVNCYENLRGEVVFGAGVAYVAGAREYQEPTVLVNARNSVVGRVLALLDYLAYESPHSGNPDPSLWRRYIRSDPGSPYSGVNTGPGYPDWSSIILAGHSQGGGHAAMLGMNLASPEAAQAVVMLSSPNDFDNSNDQSASWLNRGSSTPTSAFWGLRHSDDNRLGGHVAQNWEVLGGAGFGGVGGHPVLGEIDIGDGSGAPAGAHRLVLTAEVADGDSAHGSTNTVSLLPGVAEAWRYLFDSASTGL